MAALSKEKKSLGCMGKFLGLSIFTILSGMAACLYFAAKPQDLSDLKKLQQKSEPRDLKLVLEKAVLGQYSVSLSEAELNQWLAHQISAKQAGIFSKWISVESVLLRLREGIAEVIVERNVAGFPMTTSLFLQLEKKESLQGMSTQVHLHGGAFHKLVNKPVRGGRFGQLSVPQGFLMIMFPEFTKISETILPEIEKGFEQMNEIQIKDQVLFLDPRLPKEESLNTTF